MARRNKALEFVLSEVRRLNTQWDCFEELYLTLGRDRLRSHAGHLLTVVRVALATDIVLTISRLCDSLGAGEREHVVFQRFLRHHPRIRTEVSPLVNELHGLYTKEIEPVRHGRLAHNSLLLIRGRRRIRAPKIRALRRGVELCTEIVCALSAGIQRVATSMVNSHARGEVDWMEASLRFLEPDRSRIHETLIQVRRERDADKTV